MAEDVFHAHVLLLSAVLHPGWVQEYRPELPAALMAARPCRRLFHAPETHAPLHLRAVNTDRRRSPVAVH